jgi:hypothetical protein
MSTVPVPQEMLKGVFQTLVSEKKISEGIILTGK